MVYTDLTNKLMITILVIALILVIGSMSIGNINSNAFARSSHHDHHVDNKGNDRHGCIYQKHVSVDQRYVCGDHRHESSDVQQEEIILSSPGLPQQQLYLNHIAAGCNP
jgi:hypothetical protein